MDSEDDCMVEDLEDGSTSEDESVSKAYVSQSQTVLSLEATGRVFLVSRVERASGGYRPHFLFNGTLVEVLPGHSGERPRLVQVLNTKELQLSLRYEPPSPKFTRSVHGIDMVSYRLKLLDDQEFIYLQRGLPKVMVLDEHIRAVSWGQLQLVFHTDQQLASFLKVLRHVEVVHDQLWPRSVAALWGVEEKGASQRPVHLASSSSKLGQGLSCSQGQIGTDTLLTRGAAWVQQHKTACVLASAATGTLLLTAAYFLGRGSREGKYLRT